MKRLLHSAIEQLTALGYVPGDRVYVRLLLPKTLPAEQALRLGLAWEPEPNRIIKIPIDGYLTLSETNATFTRLKRDKKTNRFNPTKTFDNGFDWLRSQNARGYGVYLVVNAGGREDSDIVRCPALFYECDYISKEEQWKKVESLRSLGLDPSLAIETRNSLHVYLLGNDIAVSEFPKYQQRLIQLQDADQSNFNPSRLMRIAGFDHQQWNVEANCFDEPFECTIRYRSDSRYALAQFDNILPAWNESRWSEEKRTKATKENVQRNSTNGSVIESTNANNDAYDLRNLAHYIEGYDPNGRREWITCKCPVHNGVSFDSLQINISNGKYVCHAGCSGKDIRAEVIRIAKSRGHVFPVTKPKPQTPAERTEQFREHIQTITQKGIVHAQAKDSDTIRRSSAPNPRDLFRLGYDPDVVVNQRYLDLENIDTKGSRLIVIKSAMDTGKTTGLVNLIPNDVSLQTFANTILLAQSLSKKFGCAFYKDASADELNQANRLTITPNSLPRLLTYQKQYDYVVIDEADQIIEAMVAGPLCKNERHLIIQKVQYFLFKAKTVILSDADISSPIINWVAHVMNEKPFVIVNEYQPFAGRVAYEFSSKEAILAYQNRLLSEGNRIAIATDSRATAKGVSASMAGLETIEGYDNIDLENDDNDWIRQLEASHPDRKIRTIHGDNSNTPDTKAFVQNVNEQLRTNPLDALIFNSALQSGTSIDERPEGERQTFDAVTSILSGTTLPFTHIAQLPHRVRAKVPFAFWFSDKLRKGLETNPLTIAERLIRNNKESGFVLNVDIETGMLEPNDPALLQLRSELEARRNYALMNNRELFIEYLSEMGYDIQKHPDDEEEPETKHSDTLKQCRRVETEAEAASKLVAADITDEEASDLRNVIDPDFETRCILAKHDLKNFYGREVTRELIALDKNGELSRNLRLLELVLSDVGVAQRKDLSERKRCRSIADLHHHTLLRNLLIDSGVLDVLDPDTDYSEANLAPFAESVKAKAAELKAFGIGIRVASRDLKERRHKAKSVTALLETKRASGWYMRWLISLLAARTTPHQYIENEAISESGGTEPNRNQSNDSSRCEPSKADVEALFRSLTPLGQLIGVARGIERHYRATEAGASEVHGVILKRLGLKREEVGRIGRKRIYRIQQESWAFAMSVLRHRQQQREERTRQRDQEVETEARRFDAMTPTDMLAAIEKEIATDATKKQPALAFLPDESTRTTGPQYIENEAFEARGGTASNRSTGNDSSFREPVKVGSAVLVGTIGLEYATRYGWVLPNEALEVVDIVGAKYQRNENEKGIHAYLKVRSKGGFARTLPAEWFVSGDTRPCRFDPFGEVGQIPYRSLALWEDWLLGATCAEDIVRFERLRSQTDLEAFRSFLSHPKRNDTLQIMAQRFGEWGIERDWLPEPTYPQGLSDRIIPIPMQQIDPWLTPLPADPWTIDTIPTESGTMLQEPTQSEAPNVESSALTSVTFVGRYVRGLKYSFAGLVDRIVSEIADGFFETERGILLSVAEIFETKSWELIAG